MHLFDQSRKVLSNKISPAANRIIAMRDKYLPDYALVMIDHDGEIFYIDGIKLGERTIVVLSYIFGEKVEHLISSLEPLRFNVILPYYASPILDSAISKKYAKKYATGKVLIAAESRYYANIGIYVDRKSKSAVLILNDVMHDYESDEAYVNLVEIEMAQIFARLAVVFDLDEARYLDAMLELVEAYTSPKINIILNNVVIDAADTYTVMLSVMHDGIVAKLILDGHPIKGYSDAGNLKHVDGARIVECKLDDAPRMHGEITIRWDVMGRPVAARYKNFVVMWRGKKYYHENISPYDENGVCTGTWRIPKLDTGRDVGRQVREAIRALIAVLEYPNIGHRYRYDVRQIGRALAKLCSNRSKEEEVVWEA